MTKTKYNTEKRSTLNYHERVEKIFKKIEEIIKRPLRFTTKRSFEAFFFLIIFFAFFGLLAYKMTLPKMLNTFMHFRPSPYPWSNAAGPATGTGCSWWAASVRPVYMRVP